MRAYREALERGRVAGAARADNEAVLAMICQSAIQPVAGAVAPSLVFNGARAAGIDARTLIGMPPRDIAALQWN